MSGVAITGLGLVSSLGWDAASVTASLEAERTSFAAETRLGFPVCPVTDEGCDRARRRLDGWRFRRYLSRGGRFAVLAGLRAAYDAGLDAEPSLAADTAVIGTAAPMLDVDREPGLPPGDPLDLDALWLLRWLPNTPVSALAMLLGLHGEGISCGCACASGLAALGLAWNQVRHGLAPRCLVVCGDSRLSLGGMLGYAKCRTVSRRSDPLAAERPFDRERDGFVPGEGGAAFVLEDETLARARGARILGSVLGCAATLDGLSLTAPDPAGVQAERAVRLALDRAGVTPGGVEWVSAHGTGTAGNDGAEAAMLARVFGAGPNGPVVMALKSWVGHCSSAAGGVETAICLMAASRGLTVPVRNLREPVADLRFARRLERRPGAAPTMGLVESFGFGGQNAALVLRTGDGA